MKIYRIHCILLLLSIHFQYISALIPTDSRTRLTKHWEFIRQDMGSIWEVMRPISGNDKPETLPLWEEITLPHCFNAEDAVDPDVNYYQGPGWYRTTLSIQNPYPNGRIYLEFEGAGQKTEVYIYTQKVASHIGGYDEWKVDITDAVAQFCKTSICRERFKGRIPVAIRCDNSRDTELIPSDMSDFNLYGGLYRYVNLIYTPSSHLEYIHITPRMDEQGKQGEVSIKLQTTGHDWQTINLRVLAPNGRTIWNDQLSHTGANLQTGFTLKHPQTWSPDQPNLYTVITELIVQNDTIQATEHFGFRHYRFEENGPFYLNGQRLLLHGTHRHEDHAGVGAALTEKMMRMEMKQIKDMGANFIRLGHYQQSSVILNLCDELGLLVWEEIPWCRGGLGGNRYKEQARQMLKNMIRQHYNHPSIILWGLGNENDWPGDFEYFNQDSIRSFMNELNELAHHLDATRSTVIRRCDFCKDIVDVYSPTIWAGWYSRKFQQYQDMAKTEKDRTRHFLHAEWGGDSHAGRHAEEQKTNNRSSFDIEAGDRNGDWSESYIIRLFDWHLKEQETMPWLTGSLFWTFKDFSTPLRPYNPIPYVNQKGVVQRDGTPKESYYVFQSYWSKQPMLHIYGHTWPVRWGKPDEEKEVLVYSNCDEVELFVNGVSQGKKQRNSQDYPAAGFHWNVKFTEGSNKIEAIGQKDNQRLHDQIRLDYQTKEWGEATQIRLSQNILDPDTILIQAEVLDKEGIRCLDASHVIEFSSTARNALVQNQGTARGSRRIQAANGLASIYVHQQEHAFAVQAQTKGEEIKPALITISPAQVKTENNQ